MDEACHPEAPDKSDVELMEAVRSGNLEAFEALVRRHQRPLLNFFRRMGVGMDVEDMTQETFVRLFRSRERYRPEAGFKTFLYTIARNAWIDVARKKSRFALFLERTWTGRDETDDGGMGAAMSRVDISQALKRLPEKLRSVVVLNVCQGLKYDEIGAVLGIPHGTVKSRMFTALNRLKEALDERKS